MGERWVSGEGKRCFDLELVMPDGVNRRPSAIDPLRQHRPACGHFALDRCEKKRLGLLWKGKTLKISPRKGDNGVMFAGVGP